MVYTHISIIQGIVLTREQIAAFFKSGIEEDEEFDLDLEGLFYDNFIKGFEKNLRGAAGLRLFPFPCCSESANDKFILGYELSSFSRRHISCEKCEEHSLCDRCIGETTRGFYDVQKILDSPVQIPEGKLCNSCCLDSFSNGRCESCFSYHQRMPEKFSRVEKFAKKILKMKDVDVKENFYYMLDDCLSCT